MTLTSRGRTLALTALFTVGLLIGFLLAPYSISYENGVRIVNTYEHLEDK